MAKKTKDSNLSLEEKLEQALIPNWDEPYKLPDNWCWLKLLSAFDNYTDSKKKIQQKNYLSSGLYAIIDQGQKLVGGYTDDESMLYDKNLPVVIFGDHTRCVKYVDFSFAQGADGVKVLRPKPFYFPKLFYYAMQSVDIPNLGYRRHFPLFDKFAIPLPPFDEQHRIVARIESLFAKLDEAKEKAQEVVEGYKFRKESILYNALQGKLTVSLNDNDMQCGWTELTLGELILGGPQNGLYKSQNAYGQGTKILRIDGFYDGWLEPWDTLKRLTVSDEEIKLYGLNINDIVINRVNSMAYLGKSALIRNLPETCVYESNMMRISLDTSKIVPEYLIYYLNSSLGLEELRKNAKQAVNQASINQQDVKSVSVPVPSIYEQQKIVDILDNLISKEKRSKETAESVIEQIGTMKKAILARAFRGELGTNDPSEESAMELVKEILAENNEVPSKISKRTRVVIPKEIDSLLKIDLERKIIRLFLKSNTGEITAEEIMALSSKKIDLINSINSLKEKKLIEQLKNGLFILLR